MPEYVARVRLVARIDRGTLVESFYPMGYSGAYVCPHADTFARRCCGVAVWREFFYRDLVRTSDGQYHHRRMAFWRRGPARDGGTYSLARIRCRLRYSLVLPELPRHGRCSRS